MTLTKPHFSLVLFYPHGDESMRVKLRGFNSSEKGQSLRSPNVDLYHGDFLEVYL